MARMPDDMAARYGAILEEFERAIKVLNESKSETLTELRGELKSLGYEGGEIGAEVAMLKAAVKQIGMSQRERQKADEKDEGVSDYITVLSLARARAREDEQEHDADGVIIEPNSAPAESSSPAMAERATGNPSNGLHDAGEGTPLTSPADIQPETAAQTVATSGAASLSSEHEAVESSEPYSAEQANDYGALCGADVGVSIQGGDDDNSAGKAGATVPHEPEQGTDSSGDYQREPATVPLVSDPLPDADAQRLTAGPNSPAGEVAAAQSDEAEGVSPLASSAPPKLKMNPEFFQEPHPACMRPQFCGGNSRLALCEQCKAAADQHLEAAE